MNRIHDDEVDTSAPVVRALLAEHCPQWADLEPEPLLTTGTDNAMWRIDLGEGLCRVVRLPRTDGAATSMAKEQRILPALTGRLPVSVPTIAYAGRPDPHFPHPWAVLDWLDGTDAWSARARIDPDDEALALDLATTVAALGAVTDVDVPNRVPGDRGGPLLPLVERLERWLTDPRWSAEGLVDVVAVKRSAAESAEAAAAEVVADRFVHGDLIPGNVLLSDGRLSAVIDWGGAGIGDAALDLMPAWTLLGSRGAQVFREATGASDAAWLRARAFALEQAVGGVVYYVPRRHPLGYVMARSLARILETEA